jgi:hypothetical protein
VTPDGEFDVTVETPDSTATSAVEVSSDGFGPDVSLSVNDGDGDTPEVTNNGERVEFIDVNADGGSYVLNVDVTGGSEGDSGTITVYSGGEANENDYDEKATSTFNIGSTYSSPVTGVSDKLWTEVTGDGTLTLGDLGTAIQEYQDNGQVNGVDISLGDLGSLIQEYQN